MKPTPMHPRPWRRIALVLGALSLLVAACAAPSPRILTPLETYRVEGPPSFQPSGLCLVEGRLYTVSDKHDGLFELVVAGDGEMRAAAVGPRPVGLSKLDLEGLCHVDGTFYAVSEHEKQGAIYRWTSEGEWKRWSKKLRKRAEEAGLFQRDNARAEGLARVGNGFLVAAEREPRGFIRVSAEGRVVSAELWPGPDDGRPVDFAGLEYREGQLFTLEKNAGQVVVRDTDGAPREVWSFEAVAQRLYPDEPFGMAEGIALDDTYLWVVFDTNQWGDISAKPPRAVKFARPDRR